jgi:uncharacterized protein (TIGR03437 family)
MRGSAGWVLIWAVLFSAAGSISAQTAGKRYALIMDDPPAAAGVASRQEVQSAAAQDRRLQVEARQRTLRDDLASRGVEVTGSASTLLNAVFVVASEDRLSELQSLPGVKAVVPERHYHRSLNRATQLLNAPAAWSALGGAQNAGAGIKIAILDTGIDQTHPAFQDSSLAMPPGYPICSGSDCNFTNSKVIVARSYVRQLAAGSSPGPAADSRPDDYSPRDRDGHGTAVASCAAGVSNTGAVTISGMAPKAYLGNYKIYGSPEVNDFATDGVIIQALEDALNDGMDVVSFSSGGPAFSGPLDTGSACGNNSGVPCDLVAQAFENAAQAGMIVVAAAGNQGQDGNAYPTFNSISSPADAPSVIAAGASTNSHAFSASVGLSGPGAPANLQNLAAQPGGSFAPIGAVSAPLRDVTQLGDNGLACATLPAFSLSGAFALIERGTCTFAAKLTTALAAGAVGVVFYMADASASIPPGGLTSFSVPAVMVSNADGLALKSFVDANPDPLTTIDPTRIEQMLTTFNQLAGFSSRGPSTGDFAVKPDLVAVGTNVYFAAENYDPLGELYSSSRYAVADGTSFATPLVAGAAALVKQSRPNFSTSDVKSALVNTASQDVTTDDSGNAVTVQSLGAGKLDAGAAVSAAVTVRPVSISFGALAAGSLPASRQLQIVNRSAGTVALSIAVAPGNQSSGTRLTLDQQSLSLAPNASGTVTVRLSGAVPPAGSYSGAITVQGQGISLRVPYMYLVGSGTAANIIPLSGASFDGTVGQGIPEGIIAFRLVDSFGVPVKGAPVSFSSRGGGRLTQADSVTDAFGIAAAQPVLGAQPGNYSFTAVAGGMSLTFSGTARAQPNVPSNGVADAASFDDTRPVAPGSYIAIFGSGLSDTTDAATTTILPLAIDFVHVSFDAPSPGPSVPGHLTYVSPGQVNVQVPWELQGQTSVQIKVSIDFSDGNVITLPLSDYAPSLFEFGAGVVASLDQGFQVIGSSNPAQRGQTIHVFANGLGPVTNQPASGEPAPSSPPALTTTTPVVTIGGQQAQVTSSGLTPGSAGLYELDLTVPPDLTPGNYPISVTIGNRTSKSSAIFVQ